MGPLFDRIPSSHSSERGHRAETKPSCASLGGPSYWHSSCRVVGTRLDHDAFDKALTELFKGLDFGLGPALRHRHTAERQTLRSPRECHRRESGILTRAVAQRTR